mgnify:CR=1 FL=1
MFLDFQQKRFNYIFKRVFWHISNVSWNLVPYFCTHPRGYTKSPRIFIMKLNRKKVLHSLFGMILQRSFFYYKTSLLVSENKFQTKIALFYTVQVTRTSTPRLTLRNNSIKKSSSSSFSKYPLSIKGKRCCFSKSRRIHLIERP